MLAGSIIIGEGLLDKNVTKFVRFTKNRLIGGPVNVLAGHYTGFRCTVGSEQRPNFTH